MEQKNSGNTIKLHRVLRAPAEVVYRAFLDPQAKCKWLPPHGYTAEMHHCDARVGGSYRMSFTNFRTGLKHTFGGQYLELTPGKLIRFTDKFEDPNLPGEIQVKIELKPVSCGTDVSITQENIPKEIPTEHCYLGWQESLTLLALLIEPNIE